MASDGFLLVQSFIDNHSQPRGGADTRLVPKKELSSVSSQITFSLMTLQWIDGNPAASGVAHLHGANKLVIRFTLFK
jgi:hypothetical protein